MEPNFDLCRTQSPVEPQKFHQFLRGYPEAEREFLVQGFTQGFKLGFQGPRNRVVETENLPFCVTYPSIIWEKIALEVKAKRVAGLLGTTFKAPLGWFLKLGSWENLE